MKIYDATKISEKEFNDIFVKACYFGDTKEEVRNQEQAGMLIRWTENGFEFAGMLGRFRYLRVSARLTKLLNLAKVHQEVGERMLKGYWTFMRSLEL